MRSNSVMIALGLLLATLNDARAQSRLNGPQDCFENLRFSRASEIICQFPVKPMGRDLDDLIAVTRGYLRDVQCVVDVRVPRAMVVGAMATADQVLEVPPQPVRCDVVVNLSGTEVSRYTIGATFAPRVVMRGGVAVDASPGLADITGVSRVVSWPVEAYVNRGTAVRDGMLQVVNAWRTFLRPPGQ